ncbi:MAG: serine hydrolase domain-containing protein [Planctomycetota bacterium]
MNVSNPVPRVMQLVVAWLTLVVLSGVSTDAANPDSDPDVPTIIKRADIPGLGLAVVTPDELRVSIYGDAKVGQQPATEETVFEAASLTKPVVAYLVMRLVERDVLRLDDRLIELLPSLPLPADDARSQEVTVRMALAHMTGLDGPDDRMLTFAEDPGTTFRFYPAGYRLVQRIIEDKEGASLDVLAKRDVFDPLGMTSSSLVYLTDFADRLATRHGILISPIDRDRDPSLPANAAASLMTTTRDYGLFLQAMLQPKGLSEASVKAMLTPQIKVEDPDVGVAWGIGWGLEPQKGTFFHWGDDGAAKCFTIGSRSDERAMVYFTNSFYGMSIADEMSKRYFPGDKPSVEWLGYKSWDSPYRLARRDILRAFVDGGADAGMQVFEDYESRYESLNIAGVANWMVWLLELRDLHEGRIRVLNWQRGKDPKNVDVFLNLAKSHRALGDYDAAIKTLLEARDLADPSLHTYIDGQVSWVEDSVKANANQGKPPELDPAVYVGSYTIREITEEDGKLWYQREGRPRYLMTWMHGTTFDVEELASFRIRFVLEEGRSVKLIAYDSDGGTDESLRSAD